MPEKLLTLHSRIYTIPKAATFPHYAHCSGSTYALQLRLRPPRLLPKLTGKPQLFKGQRLQHVYDASPEESRQGERGGQNPQKSPTVLL